MSGQSRRGAVSRAGSRPVLLLLNLGHALDHMGILIFPSAVLAMEGAFGRSYGELLSLSVGGFIAFAAGSVPAGWLGDRWSRRKMMLVFFFGMAVAATLTGLSTAPWMLAASLTLLGLFAAIYHPVGIALLVGHAGRLGSAIGVNGVCGNLGVAAAPLLSGGLAAAFGWRAVFVVFALASFLAGLAFLFLVPEQPAPGERATARHYRVPRPALLRAIAVLTLVSIAGGVVFNATTVAMPKIFAERVTGIVAGPSQRGALVSAVFVAGAMAQIIVGRLIDRYPLKRVFVPLSALQAPSLFLAASASDGNMVAAAAITMFAVFGQMTINDSIVARYTSDSWRARAFAVRYLVTFIASAAAVPLVAFLHDGGGGFHSLLIVLAGFGAVIFLAALAFPPGRPEAGVEPGGSRALPVVRPQAAE